MTTRVKITHQNDPSYPTRLLVQAVDPKTGAAVAGVPTVTLKGGESCEHLYAHGGMNVVVSELPE